MMMVHLEIAIRQQMLIGAAPLLVRRLAAPLEADQSVEVMGWLGAVAQNLPAQTSCL